MPPPALMATQGNIHENGFTVLYESPHPTVEYVTWFFFFFFRILGILLLRVTSFVRGG